MAGQGRKKKITAFKLLEGNLGKRPLPENEPKPRPIAPKVPRHIDTRAKKKWAELAPTLERLGVLTESDGDLFAALCQIMSRLERIVDRLRVVDAEIAKIEKSAKLALGDANLIALRTERGRLMKEERQYYILMQKYGGEFGLTPRSRTGVQVKKPGDDDEGILT